MDLSTPLPGQPSEVLQNTTDQQGFLSFLSTFPPEIRISVCEQAILDSLVNPPTLLAALKGHPKPQLYAEAKEVYDRVYHSINSSTAAALQRESLRERLKIKHLEIEGLVNFRGQTILMMNNLQVLTLDYSTAAAAKHPRPLDGEFHPVVEDAMTLVPLLINASKNGGKTQVRKFVLKRKDGIMLYHERIIEKNQSALLNEFSNALGVDPVENGVLDGEVLYWVWEARQGETLTWNRKRLEDGCYGLVHRR